MSTYPEAIQKHKEAFKEDPVFKEIQFLGLESELFEDEYYFSRISFNSTMATKQAAEILGLKSKEYRLNNLLKREHLKEYIQLFRKHDSSRYRYDWKSLFRFKMVLFLTDERKMTPIDIEAIIGKLTEVREEGNFESFPTTSDSKQSATIEKRLQELSNENSEIQETQKYLFVLSHAKTLENEVNLLEAKLDALKNEQTMIDRQKRYVNLMLLKNHSETAVATKEPGFLDRLFGKGKSKPDIEPIKKEADPEVEELLTELANDSERVTGSQEKLKQQLEKKKEELGYAIGQLEEISPQLTTGVQELLIEESEAAVDMTGGEENERT